MRNFKSTNGHDMVTCRPLHFQVQSENADGTGKNVYFITVGNIIDSYICVYDPEKKILSISEIAYAKDTAQMKFYAETFEDASKLCLNFAKGHFNDDMKDTIYFNNPSQIN